MERGAKEDIAPRPNMVAVMRCILLGGGGGRGEEGRGGGVGCGGGVVEKKKGNGRGGEGRKQERKLTCVEKREKRGEMKRVNASKK